MSRSRRVPRGTTTSPALAAAVDDWQANVVFLERGDLRSALRRPLNETLTAEITPSVGEITAEEGANIDRLTRSRVFQASPLQAQDGSFIMVLAPAPN